MRSKLALEIRLLADHIYKQRPPMSLDKPENEDGTWLKRREFLPGDAIKDKFWENYDLGPREHEDDFTVWDGENP